MAHSLSRDELIVEWHWEFAALIAVAVPLLVGFLFIARDVADAWTDISVRKLRQDIKEATGIDTTKGDGR